MKTITTLLLLLTFTTLALCIRHNSQRAQNSQNVLMETEDSSLHIHIVPHSHDDLGWLKTVDQYYVGDPNNSKVESVKKILDSVIPVLKSHPDRKFIYVEVGFFKMWWDQQNDDTKSTVRDLVKNGQLEFINGGYAMNDEADVYYEDCIEQMTLGHTFLLENFNITPQVGWQIDPFGHASAQAAMFAQMGFNAFFVARVDYQDKEKRLNEKAMELVWVPQTSQGDENAILTHINYHHYSNPSSFCFDILCSDTTITDSNVASRSKEFVDWFKDMSKNYKTKELFHTAGDDFHYMKADQDYDNYDRLFKYITDHPNDFNAKVFYSNPSQYLNAIYPLNVTYPLKTDDFFPYADKANAYWTGYFTSRPSIKSLTREEGRYLQASRRLATQLLWEQSSDYLQDNFEKVDQALNKLEDALAIAQHHDAVAGTEKQAVAEDYKFRLCNGEDAVNKQLLFPVFQELVENDLGIDDVTFSTCRLNETASQCEVTNNNLNGDTPVLLAVYNSGPARTSTIQVKVPHAKIQAYKSDGSSIPTDVICANGADAADCDLYFSDQVKNYDTSYYYLLPQDQSNEVSAKDIQFNQAYKISSTQTISLDRDLSSFSLKKCKDANLKDCYNTKFTLSYNYYPSYQSSSWDGESQKSGAYIFRPAGSSQLYSTPATAKIYQGKNLLQIRLDGGKVRANLKIYNDIAKGVVLDSYVDSINVDDQIGKEVVMRVSVPSIQNNNTFYTDSMGMEMQKRVLNYRPTWTLDMTEPVAGNYYPIQSTIQIKDKSSGESFSVLPDRTQGGASLKQGQIELMIHRRILYDDGRGVAEPLNEKDKDGNGLRQLVQHVLLFNKPGYVDTTYRQVQTNIDMPVLVLLAAVSERPSSSENEDISESNNLRKLESDIKVMTRPLSTNKFLFRFQNMGETQNKTVSTDVFKSESLGAGKVVEMSLTGNQAKTDMLKKRLNWNGLKLNDPKLANQDYLNSDKFTLRPLEIRTFVVSFDD